MGLHSGLSKMEVWKLMKGASTSRKLLESLVCPLPKEPLRLCENSQELINDSLGVAYPERYFGKPRKLIMMSYASLQRVPAEEASWRFFPGCKPFHYLTLNNIRKYNTGQISSLITASRGELIFYQSFRSLTSHSILYCQARIQHERKDIAAQDEDPFDPLTDKIPERPVTFVEGASYSVAILLGFAVAAAAAYAVFKELVFEPKEYKIFGKALDRVQNDNQVTVRLGSPITGYGQESRNRAARQRIPNRVWIDEDGTERVEVQFYIRGPHGAGKVYSEMFKDKVDRKWKFTYLLVDVLSPSPTRLMLESYVPT